MDRMNPFSQPPTAGVPRAGNARHAGGRGHGGGIIAVLVVLALIVGVVGGAFAARAWYHANPVTVTVTRTRTVDRPMPSDSKAMRAFAVELKRQRPDLDDADAAAILGNVWGESKGEPAALENGASTPPANAADDAIGKWAAAGHGIGALQWTGERATALIARAQAAHEGWRSVDIQVAFLLTEMDDAGMWRQPMPDGMVGIDGADGLAAFRSAGDVRTATSAMLRGFVRPADPAASEHARLIGALSMYTWLQSR